MLQHQEFHVICTVCLPSSPLIALWCFPLSVACWHTSRRFLWGWISPNTVIAVTNSTTHSTTLSDYCLPSPLDIDNWKKQMSSWRHSPINSLANVLTLLRNLSSDLFPPNRMSYDFHFPSRKNNVHQKLKTASSRWFIDSEWINTMLKSKRVARSSSIYGKSGSAMCERQTWNKARKKTRKRKSIQPDVAP